MHLLGTVMMALLIALVQAAKRKTVLLRLGHEMPRNHLCLARASKFAAILDKKVNGRMESRFI